MPDEELLVNGETATMRVRARVVATSTMGSAVALYVVTHADVLHHGDESFFVVLFPDCLWVVPGFTAGLNDLLSEIVPALARARAVHVASCGPRPIAWRARVLGVPLFPIPALGKHALSTLPDWLSQRPMTASEINTLLEGT